MGEYVSIQEGSQSKAFNGLNKLETDVQGGDSCFWVPKSARQLESISINANGTYYPEEKYGINRANISVPGTSDKISGKGQDGNDYTVSLDDNTGDLIKTKVPSSIAITQLPTTLQYEDGDRISFINIEVTAYDGEGNEFDIAEYPDGVIPFEELQFPITIAVNDNKEGADYSDDGYIKAVLVHDETPIIGVNGNTYWISSSIGTVGERSDQGWAGIPLYLGHVNKRNPTWVTQYNGILYYYGDGITTSPVIDLLGYVDGILSPSIDSGGSINYWNRVSIDSLRLYNTIPESTIEPSVPWIPSPTGDIIQPIPVNWPRYNDGKILTASFDITVSPKASTNTNNEDDGFTGHDGSIDDDSGGGGGHSF